MIRHILLPTRAVARHERLFETARAGAPGPILPRDARVDVLDLTVPGPPPVRIVLLARNDLAIDPATGAAIDATSGAHAAAQLQVYARLTIFAPCARTGRWRMEGVHENRVAPGDPDHLYSALLAFEAHAAFAPARVRTTLPRHRAVPTSATAPRIVLSRSAYGLGDLRLIARPDGTYELALALRQGPRLSLEIASIARVFGDHVFDIPGPGAGPLTVQIAPDDTPARRRRKIWL